jgi:hypothetical protein
MADLVDYDKVVDAVSKFVADWEKAIKDAAQKLADIQAEMDKMEALKKQRDAAAKDAEKASKDLSDKIFGLKVSPKADPKPFDGLPDAIKKMITKGGLPLGKTGVTLVPDNWKFDPPPKFKVNSGGVKLKIDF